MTSGKSNLVDVTLDKVRETEKAWLVRTGDKTPREIWLPKSQCEDNSDGTFSMPNWLADAKALL